MGMFLSRIPITNMPRRGGSLSWQWQNEEMSWPVIATSLPASKARRMRTSRANTVPPGAAIWPRTPRAERKTVRVERASVRKMAMSPDGGQKPRVILFFCANFLVLDAMLRTFANFWGALGASAGGAWGSLKAG